MQKVNARNRQDLMEAGIEAGMDALTLMCSQLPHRTLARLQ